MQVRKPKVKQENGFDENDVSRGASKLNTWLRVWSMMMIHLLSNLTIALADRVLESNSSRLQLLVNQVVGINGMMKFHC